MITINNKKLCENCFAETTLDPCPHCGFSKSTYRHDPVSLMVGSVLSQRYMIGGVIGKGGFGITYLAYDLKLDARVAVKEYYPMGLAVRSPGSTLVTVSNQESGESFRTGAEKFYNEAKMVAQFNGNPNIVSVHDFFYENDTVYFIMGYLQGQTLKSYLKNNRVTEGQAMSIFGQISNALFASHSMSILHRDVSPDNIMLCDDGTIRLLDFGAARQVVAEKAQGLSVILKQGFAPLEQYQKTGKQGPWTDIYALGATVYNALTGAMLNDPMSRLEDDSDFENNKFGISEPLWKVIRKCTQLKIPDRYQDISELKKDLDRVGIDTERFSDVKHEMTEFLKGGIPAAPEPPSVQPVIPQAAPGADPNATVLLSAQQPGIQSGVPYPATPVQAPVQQQPVQQPVQPPVQQPVQQQIQQSGPYTGQPNMQPSGPYPGQQSMQPSGPYTGQPNMQPSGPYPGQQNMQPSGPYTGQRNMQQPGPAFVAAGAAAAGASAPMQQNAAPRPYQNAAPSMNAAPPVNAANPQPGRWASFDDGFNWNIERPQPMNPLTGILSCLKHFVGFGGRACRMEYFSFQIFCYVILTIFTIISGNSDAIDALYGLFFLVSLLPRFAVTSRRLHDVGMTGWLALAAMIPFVGHLILLIWTVRDSVPGPNRYGYNPKGM